MEADDGLRDSRGVTACLVDRGDNVVRLVLDDTEHQPGDGRWRATSLYTFMDFEKDGLSTLSLTRDQFAEIGENLVMRLLALHLGPAWDPGAARKA